MPDSELEPDSTGKSHLVLTVPQSGEAAELLAIAAPLGTGAAGELRALSEVSAELMLGRRKPGGTEQLVSPSCSYLCWQNSSSKSRQLDGAAFHPRLHDGVGIHPEGDGLGPSSLSF